MAISKQRPNAPDQNSMDAENKTAGMLEKIPGIGKKIRVRLMERYGNEQVALSAVREGKIGQIPGISPKQAIKIAQNCFEFEEQIKIEDVLKTPDVILQYNHVVDIIQHFFQTEYAKAKIQLYFPLPKTKLSLIQVRQHYFERSLRFALQHEDNLEKQGLSRLLAQLSQFKTEYEGKSIRNRIIITDSSEILNRLKEEDAFTVFPMERIDLSKEENIPAQFKDLCRSYEIVIFIGDDQSELPDLPNLIPYTSQQIGMETIFPENIIHKFARNKTVIQNCIKMVVMLKNLPDAQDIGDFLQEFDIKRIKTIKEKLDIIDNEGKILSKIDPQLDKYREIAHNFASILNTAVHEINEDIRKEIASRSIHLDGKQILELYRADLTIEAVRNYIPPEVDQIIQDKLHTGLEALSQTLLLTKGDKDLVLDLMPETIEYPINLPNESTQKLEKVVQSRATTYNYIALRQIAAQLQDSITYLFHLLQVLLDFDFFYGIGRFGKQLHLHIPSISESDGFFGEKLVNLDLVFPPSSSIENKPIPICYQVGDIGDIGDIGDHNILNAHLNLLTGSNSGGKTMCMLTCLQAILLAQMGLPTLGSVQFSPFEEIYFFKKSSGQLSAGAFETTLLQFVDLAHSSQRKIVFADELEAITEPNAAAKVMAGLFHLFLTQKQNFGVFVTHLAELILQELDETTKKQIRIDGIEATGLDGQLNLIIDRNPKLNFMAKSTPELILRRLAKSGSNVQQDFFGTLLCRFNNSKK